MKDRSPGYLRRASAALSRRGYRAAYGLLRRSPILGYAARKLAAWPWLEGTRIYQYFFWKRIRGLVREWADFPPVVLFELTSACNASCVFCPLEKHPLNVLAQTTGADGSASVPEDRTGWVFDRSGGGEGGTAVAAAPVRTGTKRYTRIVWDTDDPRGPGHPWGVMGMELYERLVRECAELGVKKIILTGGEPMMDRTLVEKIRMAKRLIPGVMVDVFTNGSLLTEALCEEVVRSGVDNVTISYDGADRESYERVRRNLNYHKTVENARCLTRTRRRLGSKTPFVRFDMIALGDNPKMRRKFFRETKGIVDAAEMNNPHNWANTVDESAFGAEPVYGRHVGPDRQTPCYLELYRLSVHWDGTVPVCNYDYYGGGGVLPVVPGYAHDRTRSVKDISLKAAWDDKRYAAFVRAHQDTDAKRWKKMKPCVTCTHNQSWWLEPY